MTARGEPLAYLLAQLMAMPQDCTTWPYNRNSSGYSQIIWEGRKIGVARLVCHWYYGEPESSIRWETRHLCNNGHLGCFTPIHLVWGTSLDNSRDQIAAGTTLPGERNPNARLTAAQVAEIRSRYLGSQRNLHERTGPSQQELAEEFGVTQSMISKIVRGYWWAY